MTNPTHSVIRWTTPVLSSKNIPRARSLLGAIATFLFISRFIFFTNYFHLAPESYRSEYFFELADFNIISGYPLFIGFLLLALSVLSVLFLLQWKPFWIAILLWLGVSFFNLTNLYFADRGDNLLSLLFFFFAVISAGKDARPNNAGNSTISSYWISVLYFQMSLIYLFAFLHRNYDHWFNKQPALYTYLRRFDLNSVFSNYLLEMPGLLTAAAVIAIFLEVSVPLILFTTGFNFSNSRKALRWFCGIMILFHVLIGVILNLPIISAVFVCFWILLIPPSRTEDVNNFSKDAKSRLLPLLACCLLLFGNLRLYRPNSTHYLPAESILHFLGVWQRWDMFSLDSRSENPQINTWVEVWYPKSTKEKVVVFSNKSELSHFIWRGFYSQLQKDTTLHPAFLLFMCRRLATQGMQNPELHLTAYQREIRIDRNAEQQSSITKSMNCPTRH